MLTMKKLTSSEGAGKYYSQADFYTNGESNVDIESYWYGKGSEELGLSGSVDIEEFVKKMKGNLSNDISLDSSKNRVSGWDLTFSSPKSVSMMALVGGDNRLLDAHNEAVKQTLDYLENEILRVRVSHDNKQEFLSAKSLVSALFTHTTSRNLDPLLHTHSVIVNAAKTEFGKWRSISEKNIFENKMLLGKVFRSNLATLVTGLGYDVSWNRKDGTFELDEISNEQIMEHSSRRKEILDYADKHGISGAKALSVVATNSRKSKENQTKSNVVNLWDLKAKKTNFNHSEIKRKAVIKSSIENGKAVDIESIVRSAYLNLSYNEAVFKHKDLLSEAILFGHGLASSSDIIKVIDKFIENNELIIKEDGNKEKLITTSQSVDVEHENMRIITSGINELSSMSSSKILDDFVSDFQEKSSDRKLISDQVDALKYLANSQNRFTLLQGYAGVGKSFSLKAFREFSESRGYIVSGFAPTGKASKQLQDSSGIESNTIHSLLLSMSSRDMKDVDLSGHVWVIDESGMANSNQFNQLLNLAKKTNSRVYFVGDTAQLSAIEQGKPLEQAQKESSEFFVMKNVLRQDRERHPHLYNSVIHSISGDVESSFNELSKSTDVDTGVTVSKDDVISESALHYVNLLKEGIDKHGDYDHAITKYTKLFIPTNKNKRLANEVVRTELKKVGLIGKNDSQIKTLVSSKLKPEERADYLSYVKDMKVKFHSDDHSLGIKGGEYLTVVGCNKGAKLVVLQSNDGRKVEFNPSERARENYYISVYKEEEINISNNDYLRWKDTNKEIGMKNADIVKVISVSGDKATLMTSDEKRLEVSLDDDRFKHFEHEYASTIHAGQGDTYNKIVAGYSSIDNKLNTQKSLYVTLSRAANSAYVYMDDKGVVEQFKGNKGDKTSSLEHINFRYNYDEKFKGTFDHTVRIPSILDDYSFSSVKEISIYKSTFTRHELLKFIKNNTRNSYSFEEINNSIDRLQEQKKLVNSPSKNGQYYNSFTTPDSIIKEWRLGVYAEKGFNSVDKMLDEKTISKYINSNEKMSESTGALFTTTDRYIAVDIESGKEQEKFLNDVSNLSKHAGVKVRGLTISSKKADELSYSTDVNFQTVAGFSLNSDYHKHQNYSNEIWVVDQMSMIDNDSAHKLMDLAEKTGARIVFSGNRNAQKSVAAGSPIADLIDRGLTLISLGSANNKLVDKIDKATEIKNKIDRLDKLARNYLSSQHQAHYCLFAPSPHDRAYINEKIRDELIKKGELKGELSFNKLKTINVSANKLSDPLNYDSGMYIKLSVDDDNLGFSRKDYLKVVDYNINEITVDNRGKKTTLDKSWLKSNSTNIKQYKEDNIKIAVGDKIVIKEKYQNSIKNGETASVTHVNENGFSFTVNNKIYHFDNKKNEDKHFDHAYTKSAFEASFGKYKDGSLLIESNAKHAINNGSFNSVIANIENPASIITNNISATKTAIEGKENLNNALVTFESEQLLRRNNQDKKEQDDITVALSVNNAINHLMQTSSAFTKFDLVKHALNFEPIPIFKINKEIDRLIDNQSLSQSKVKNEIVLTTQAMLKKEYQVNDIYDKGINKHGRMSNVNDINKYSSKSYLTEAEKGALKHIMLSKDRFNLIDMASNESLYSLIQGVNGTAKSSRARIKLFSTRSQLSKEHSQRLDSDVGSIHSHFSFLNSQKEVFKSKNSAWLVLDSHLLSVSEVSELFRAADKANSRVIMQYDSKASHGVGGGDFVGLINKVGGKSFNFREKQTEGLNSLEAKIVTKTLDPLLIEVADKDERYKKVVNEYLSLNEQQKRDTVVVASTNKETGELTALIRKELKKIGFLLNEESKDVIKKSSFSNVEKQITSTYKQGMIIEFNRDIKKIGVNKGSYYVVDRIDKDKVVIKGEGGEEVDWQPQYIGASAINVYTKNKLEIAEGERYRFNNRIKEIKTKKGDSFIIDKITDSNIKITHEDGETFVIPKNDYKFMQFSHAYTNTFTGITSQKKVGSMIGMINSYQKNMLNQKTLYTLTSKAVKNSVFFTDNKSQLHKELNISSGNKLNALDVKENKFNVFKSQSDRPKLDIGIKEPNVMERGSLSL